MAWRRANGIERRRYSIVLIGVSVVIVCSVIGALVPAVSNNASTGPKRSTPSPSWLSPRRLPLPSCATGSTTSEWSSAARCSSSSSACCSRRCTSPCSSCWPGCSTNRPASPSRASSAAGAVVVPPPPLFRGPRPRPVGGSDERPTRRPWRLASATGARVDGDADSVVERLAATVRDELRLGSVEITVIGTEPVVAGRRRTGRRGRCPSTTRDDDVGTVVVTGRPGERIAEADRRTLEQLGHYLAVTAEAIRVGEDLRDAQQALQDAYLEERRRVRLDLHDGIGPTLASIRLRLLSLKRRLPAEPSRRRPHRPDGRRHP